uniref:7TM_GPCR_Srx domain-containing protein n=1 Tax=Heterorhabditis bacteriophora TaxID=37862 RepID=A0A1I7WSP8_HETBA
MVLYFVIVCFYVLNSSLFYGQNFNIYCLIFVFPSFISLYYLQSLGVLWALLRIFSRSSLTITFITSSSDGLYSIGKAKFVSKQLFSFLLFIIALVFVRSMQWAFHHNGVFFGIFGKLIDVVWFLVFSYLN